MLIMAVLILASSLSFGLGYLAGRDVGGIGEMRLETIPETLTASDFSAQTEQVVASKNGTKYYLPSCAGANRISATNKVWFASVSAAVTAGYSPAANCPGI